MFINQLGIFRHEFYPTNLSENQWQVITKFILNTGNGSTT